ncbi:arsenate reductase (glutaredoxin) [Winogradskyella vincentii]|uniref:Arsenate reductase (Glutaredoxin) n=1 Tax=Winogradskyella vincentii TaxID=2877122 RepID=A0ABS7XZX6_9FLAO|nr:arsenate reductase (glutaredoxin) [Winogradskyella vincentii]MCA0153213.1 arsenate reductase (glutaredoxin) [Winogradskyella vincentii]
MITIYHNPRCRKSREGLEIVEKSGKTFNVVKYLDDQLNVAELKNIIAKLEIKPIDLVRKNEAIWKSEFKGKSLTDAEIVEAMIANPKLIERPIVVNGNKAIVGRPPETINEIL